MADGSSLVSSSSLITDGLPIPHSETIDIVPRSLGQGSELIPHQDTRSGSVRSLRAVAPDRNTTSEAEQMAQSPRLSIEEIISRYHATDSADILSNISQRDSSELQSISRENEQPNGPAHASGSLAITNNDDDARSSTSSRDFPSPGAYDVRFYPPFPRMSDWQRWMRTHPDSDRRVPSIDEYDEWSNSDPDRLTRDADGNGEYTYNRFRVWREAVNFRYKGRASLRKSPAVVKQAEGPVHDTGIESLLPHTSTSQNDDEQQSSSNPWGDDTANASAPTAVHRTPHFAEDVDSENETFPPRGEPPVSQRESGNAIHPLPIMLPSSNGSTSRPLPLRPRMPPQPREIVIPRWQLDAEVTLCPICRTQFSKYHTPVFARGTY